ncbi:hypothetical protein H4R21_001197 [Coemansia helicoidea]|uniref:Uncharacterized protein n=1 Tax=Coemansia helicoidea TaxID=1286919 RepID=A0ACC1LDY4_9FUNG|nr:hypothetical protein H4R21_001197 [Coemansia helicoidea]
MGVYLRALFVIFGGLVGGSVGLYYQGKEEKRLAELRQLKLQEMQRLNRGSLPSGSGVTASRDDNPDDSKR